MGKKAKRLKRTKRNLFLKEKRCARNKIQKFEEMEKMEREREEKAQKPIIRKRRNFREQYLRALEVGDMEEAELIRNQELKFEIYRKMQQENER